MITSLDTAQIQGRRRRLCEAAEPHAPEYEDERFTAAQLGVGRFYDGRGL